MKKQRIVSTTFMFACFGFAYFLVYEFFRVSLGIETTRVLVGLNITLAILTLGFVLMMFVTHHFNNLLVRFFYTIFATWIGLFFYLFLAACVYFVFDIFIKSPAPMLGLVLIALAVIVTIGGLIQAAIIRVTKYNVILSKLPESWRGKTIAFISDIHLGHIYGERFSKKIVKKLKKLAPHSVLIGGDLFDGTKINDATHVEPFRHLSAPHGVYFVTGNHEGYGDEKTFLKDIADVGIKILNNEVALIDGLQIVGVNYHDTASEKSFRKTMQGIGFDKNIPSIFIKHVPVHLHVAEESGLSLHLSGHTHKSQIFPMSVVGNRVYKGFDYGFKMFKNMAVITSSGVGGWGPPIRVGTRSEIVFITLK